MNIVGTSLCWHDIYGQQSCIALQHVGAVLLLASYAGLWCRTACSELRGCQCCWGIGWQIVLPSSMQVSLARQGGTRMRDPYLPCPTLMLLLACGLPANHRRVSGRSFPSCQLVGCSRQDSSGTVQRKLCPGNSMAPAHPSGQVVSRLTSWGLKGIQTSHTLSGTPSSDSPLSAPAGVPTTRALSLVATGADVPRDQFYKSGLKVLPCASAGLLREGAAGACRFRACAVGHHGQKSMLGQLGSAVQTLHGQLSSVAAR